jgi:hypothetical protein
VKDTARYPAAHFLHAGLETKKIGNEPGEQLTKPTKPDLTHNFVGFVSHPPKASPNFANSPGSFGWHFSDPPISLSPSGEERDLLSQREPSILERLSQCLALECSRAVCDRALSGISWPAEWGPSAY